MKLCGLTGGVGMGKSTAAVFLLSAGARVVDTDDLAHELVQPGQPALAEIVATFGGQMIDAGGKLQRGKLAAIVFRDTAARQKLESILHPRIRERWQGIVAGWRREGCPLAVVVIPLLFETKAETEFDRIICMACSPQSQRERLAQRGWTPEQIQQRIASQMPVEEKMARSHYVIWTEGSPEVSRRQIAEIVRKP
jgi:dephospho-CoA kinase